MEFRSESENDQVVIGTPGRILDMIKREKIRCENVRIVVLDEADAMLSCGFSDQVKEVF
jgi:translation initiation factor 4A